MLARKSLDGFLFRRFKANERTRQHELTALYEIEHMSEDALLNASELDLANDVIERHTLTAPRLLVEDMFIATESATQIDVSGRFDYDTEGHHGPVYVPGQMIVIGIPFEGDPEIFHFSQTYSTIAIQAQIEGTNISIPFADVKLETDKILANVRQIADQIKEKLKRLDNDFQLLRDRLKQQVPAAISQRKKRILERRQTVASLGLPIKRSKTPTQTFVVPVKRRQHPVIEHTLGKTFTPEPALEEKEYEYILDVIDRLALSIERNPTAFTKMDEEQIRDIILVDLNGHYETGATGETFNSLGKTDILINGNERAVFIGECKIWTGPKDFAAAIDQILSYLTWRDTKAALMIFNRNKDFTAVLNSIQESIVNHPQHVKKILNRTETSNRYQFKQVNDPERDIFLTVLAFTVPQKTTNIAAP